MMPGQVVVLGSANVDLVASVTALPRPGETVTALGYASFLGGKGHNQAVAAARLGARVAFVGRVGRDDDGARVRAALAAEGVDVAHLADAGEPTGRAVITVDAAGENCIVVVPGANGRVDGALVAGAAPALAAADVLVLQLEVPMAAVIAAARAAGGTVLLNPAPAAPLPTDLLERVDVLVLNETEYEVVTGRPLPAQADALAAQLADDAALPGAVVVTAGGRGAFAWDGAALTAVPAPRVEVVDTTGAGDTFIGALANGLARDLPLVDAVTRAVHAGALSVGALGATTGMPDAAALAAAMA